MSDASTQGEKADASEQDERAHASSKDEMSDAYQREDEFVFVLTFWADDVLLCVGDISHRMDILEETLCVFKDQYKEVSI